MIPNCHYDFESGKHRILAWSMVGIVSIRTEYQEVSIDVEFMNRNFHRNLRLQDDFGI